MRLQVTIRDKLLVENANPAHKLRSIHDGHAEVGEDDLEHAQVGVVALLHLPDPFLDLGERLGCVCDFDAGQ